MTQSLEDYLEAIYILIMDKKVARVKDISQKLSVSKPSVINALKELEDRAYLQHERYGYVELTKSGMKQAEIIFRKHTMLKGFLKNILGVSDKNAEADACRIEHYLSEETISRIQDYLSSKRETN